MATRLTPLSRILIVVAILAGLFFLLKDFIPSGDGGSEQTAQVENSTEDTKTTAETTEARNTSSSPRSFDYSPPLPVNGRNKGVVELGASGFNSFIVNMDQSKNWSLKKADWGNSLVYDGLASNEDITAGLKKYISDILDYGVSGKDIHFVVSSGAQKVEATQKIIQGLKKLGYVVNTVSPEEEGTYALQAGLPKAFRDRGFMVDIGSGNTKVSWINNGDVQARETYGSKYYVDQINDNDVFDNAKKVGRDVPRGNAGTCFMLGGVPFNLAKEIRQGKERYTVLNAPDSYNPEDAKTKAGVNIMQAIAEGAGCDTFVFDWEANFTIGFLLSLPF